MVSHFQYSAQHVYQQSGNAEQMIHASNRLRSESGSSESSRGSGSTGSRKFRRRSHRPRGCRGGSNRRRNNGGEGKKKVLQYNLATDSWSHEAFRGNNFSYNNTNVPSRYSASFIPHDTHYQLQGIYSGYSNPPVDSSYSDFLPPIGTYNSNHHIDEHLGHPAGNSFGTIDIPSLQTSFSDSSNEMLGGYDDNQILPPMPTNAFEDEPPIPTGPNPYALNNSTSSKNMFNPNHMGHNAVRTTLVNVATAVPPPVVLAGVEKRTHRPGILEPLEHVCSNICQNIKIGEIVTEMGKDFALISLDQSMGFDGDQDNNYRAQRLKKQRQNVEGGSLFVTSPRSFLMGVKIAFHEPSATTENSAVESS
jgi:hypothetical protein